VARFLEVKRLCSASCTTIR